MWAGDMHLTQIGYLTHNIYKAEINEIDEISCVLNYNFAVIFSN
jgi:hypothetical protein